MSTLLRISSICRVCLKENNIMLLLFDKYASENPVEALRAAVNLEYLPNDELPNQICLECLDKAQECLAFQQQCIQSEKLFQHFLEQKDKQSQLNSCISGTNDTITQQITCEDIDANDEYDPSIKIEDDDTDYFDMDVEIDSGSYILDADTKLDELDYNVKCHICQYTFVSVTKLQKHLKVHSNADRGVLESVIWQTETPTASNEETSLRKRKKQTNFVCKTCGLRSLTLSKHKSHLKSHKESGPPQRYPCTMCDKTFINKDNVRIHLRIHTNDKRYKCTICSKMFIHWASCKSHQLTHSDKLNHFCEVCGKGYKRSKDLNIHFSATHTDKRYSCDLCNKEYRTKCTLMTHMNTHTNAKLYNCAVCGKVFNRKNSLNTHQKIHTGERSHVCSICNKGFLQKHVLQSHMRTHNVIVKKNTDTAVVEDINI